MTKIFVLALCIGLVVVVLPATAGQWDKATTVTFAAPVELPNIVLQPGTYVFRLLDTPGNRHVVQVFNAEETHLYATMLAIPNYRMKPTDKTVMPFEERAPGRPEAMHAWFYPGDNFGQEFVYPRAKAVEIAKETNEPVLAAEVTPNETPENLLQAPILTINPYKEFAQKFELQPREPITWETPPLRVPAPEPVELPKTASPVPLIGLLGLASIGLGATLGVVRKLFA